MSTTMRPEEITSIIKDRIANFESKLDINEIGTVLTIGDGVARVFGLKNVRYELLFIVVVIIFITMIWNSWRIKFESGKNL